MKIVFITPYFFPHIGGVEKHTFEVAKSLIKKGHKVTIVTEKYDKTLKENENFEGIKIIRFSYPHIKFLGLKFIWFWMLMHSSIFSGADIVHIHDVFIWYLPLRLVFPNKKIVTTFHGWEGIWPIPKKNIWYKKLAAKLSNKKVAVGSYIEKYYGIRADKIIYGGIEKRDKGSKTKNTIVYVGRLAGDTGLTLFLNWLKKNKKYKVNFVGDGPMWNECEKYGKVWGFGDPTPFLKKSEYAVPAGYLSFIEAKTLGCKIKVFPDNPLKKDYWQEIEEVEKFPTWAKIADEYLDLYNHI